MDCRPLTARDLDTAPDWLGVLDLRPDRWRDESTRAAAGVEDEELVAAGLLFTGAVHTARYSLEVAVAPRLRRRGHGSRLAAHLAGLRPQPHPLCTRGYASSDAVRFARSLGARPYQTCPPQQVLTDDGARLRDAGLRTLPGTAVRRVELWQAWIDVYTWVHATWSPVTPGREHALLAGFDDDLDLTHTRVVADPTVRAAAFVFREPSAPLVVAECRTRDEPAGLELLRACVRDCLASLAEDGVPAVTFDGHDTDPHFRPLLDELPATGEPFELLEWT